MYPIKEQELKLPIFLCFFGFISHFLLYILQAETQDKKAMGNKTLNVTMNNKKKTCNFSEFLVLTYT